MRFATFALIAGLCLAAVTANVEPIDDFDIEFLSQDLNGDYVAVEPYGAFSGIYWVCKGALKTLKKMNCAIQAAIKMQEAAQQFNIDVGNCGGIIPKQLQAIIDSSNNVITDVNNIINASDTICNNPNYTEDTDSTQKTSSKCFWNMLKQFVKLKNDIKKTLTAIKKLPAAAPDTSECVTTAVTKLQDAFNSFPAFMKTCSKLSSN